MGQIPDLKPFLANLDFWMLDKEPFMEVIAKYFRDIETSNDSTPFFKLDAPVGDLLDAIFGAFTFLAPLNYQPGFGEETGKEETEKIRKRYPYYVDGIFITAPSKDAKKVPESVFLIAHAHAPAALSSKEYLESAEVHLKETMSHWLTTADKMLYGVMFVGGRVAVYHMDKATKSFSKVIDGKLKAVSGFVLPDPGVWKPITDKEVLKSLLRIVQEEWCRIDEGDFREVIELMKVHPNQKEARAVREQRRREEQRRTRQLLPRKPVDVGAIMQKLRAEMAYFHGDISSNGNSSSSSSDSDSSKENSPNKIPRLE